MKARLTERQNEAFEFIRSYMRDFRKPPTLKEIGTTLGIRSSNGVFKLVDALERKGYIQREQHAARGIRLVDADFDPFALDESMITLPVVSRTASDQPDQLRRNPKAYFATDRYFFQNTEARNPDRCLIGRAGDDGMNGDGIHKGDFLIIEELPWRRLHNGDVAAFLIREELVARRFHFANERIHLRPADRTYTEVTFPPEDPGCYVIGRVVGLIRRL